MDRDKSRAHRLNNLLHKVLSGETTISPHNGPIFLEALYTQPDPAKCLGNLKSNSFGLSAMKAAIRFNLSSKFLNTHASALIRYLQSPEVKVINNGDFLVDILNDIVDPPIFWVEFRKAFLHGELDEDAKFSFGWLLLQLCLSSAATSSGYREDPDMPLILDALLSSTVGKIKDIGVKLQETLLTSIPCSDIIDTGEHAPGGRHNNDFADFRKISILPTGEELECTETPFLRPSSVLEDPQTEYSRVAIHLDNQFRLLREDMINELREELQIALGTKRGRHRGTKIKGLKLIGINLGDDRKRIRWSLAFQCKEDFPEMKKLKQDTKARKEFLSNKRQFFKHQSLACLLAGKEILTFPTIHRDEDRLAKSPPEIVLQFEDAESTREALRRLKLEDDITLIQVDTAVFAYEPILRGLQQASTLPLSSEILLWKDGNAPGELEASQQCSAIVQLLRSSPSANLKNLLQTAKDIQLDSSQAASLISGLSQKVSLIQGPPGTGKSFIGALIAKSIHDFSERTILVVCYTNHALDDILTGLLDIGISPTSMLRLGGKSTSKTEPLTMRNQARGQYKRSQTEWKIIDELKVQLETLRRAVEASYRRYEASNPSFSMILDYLEIEDPEYFAAFRMPESEEGMTLVGGQGKEAQSDYLFNRWSQGEDAGSLKDSISETHNLGPWQLTKEERRALMSRWKDELMKECIQEFCDNSNEYNRCCERLNRAFSAENASILRSKRIVGCTTTAAAMYREEIQTFNPDVLLVEEAGEILESHVLTALGPQASQMVLIGDHKQLRPKVNHYLLTVEKGEGYDLNRSLFERLILKNYPHLSLSQQHRMRPEISTLVRSLTYPELVDAPKTKNRPNILGMQDNIVFLHHEHPEDVDPRIGDRNDMGSTSSKQNSFEVDMILKIVKYLAQQGYGTDQLVVLTPYLGQLHRLRDVLKSITDPILNDLDSYELVRAGLITPAAAKLTRKPIRLATIDNYQGEESDIVLVSLTRSNSQCDIGFMASPERLNVLLSRARNGLIMVGNGNTFKNARKGKELWRQLFGLLHDGNHMYQGLPIRCENHPNTKALLTQVADFDEISPDGGCTLPCGVLLSCNLHSCPSKCHQLSDHSKLICKEMMTSKCPNGHAHTWPCGKGAPLTCNKCEREQKLAKQKQQKELEAQERRDAEQKAHLAMMDSLNKQIEEEKIRQEDERLAEERRKALEQKRNDLAAMQANRTFASSRQPAQSTTYNIVSSGSIDGRDITNVAPPTKASDLKTGTEPSSMNFTSNRAPIPQALKSPILNKMLDTVSSLFGPLKTIRLTTSALAGDPDPYSRVIGCSKPILGSVRVCSHGSPGAASQVLASTASTRG
ncbi:hypothetical protein D9613_006821 [Agrocybe pediades]|uniref:NFX1-type zinc finger-containing protein 1 n=1 Tax=Agrocybe pediades TaxID=84607 RepID=A0A8H4QH82_9AGAR|nr:hypothetical protein D9613_006821 [Agrocybe pediades]